MVSYLSYKHVLYVTSDDPMAADTYLNKKVLGLGSSLAISHQLLLTFPVEEDNVTLLGKMRCVEMSCRCIATHGRSSPQA